MSKAPDLFSQPRPKGGCETKRQRSDSYFLSYLSMRNVVIRNKFYGGGPIIDKVTDN